jgi:O-acetyl-ADP-ribose deacetylase (regulator of RNase III)
LNYRDAIVNPANTKLNHAGGAAKAIADAAGDDFKEECIKFIKNNKELQTGKAMMTSAGGTLLCENVIHTVGPIYKAQADNTKECQQLRDAVRSVLEIVDKEDKISVSIPAISTGIYHFPPERCCQVMGKTIRQYIDEKPSSMKGKKIIICNNDDATTSVFQEGLQIAVKTDYGSDEDEEGKLEEHNDSY